MEKAIKKQVAELLRKRDLDCLVDLCEKDRHYWHEVRFRLYDLDENLRWAAIQTVAKIIHRWWQSGKEDKVRQYIRTLFWSMNDESGGIGWSAPQTVAEIIRQIPEIIEPYGRMMIAHSLDEPPLVKGGLWGIGRLGRMITDAVSSFEDKVLATFSRPMILKPLGLHPGQWERHVLPLLHLLLKNYSHLPKLSAFIWKMTFLRNPWGSGLRKRLLK